MGATMERKLTAFGVTKTVEEWALDRRAAVYGELILRRLEAGMTPEQAIATPTIALDAGPAKYLAWGERKTLRDWADDFRCQTSYSNLRSRVEDGWTIEIAIETPTAMRTAWQITAWAETKSLRAWERDERAAVLRGVIVRRLAEGWEAERAISEPNDQFDGVTAWDETKTLFAWSKDARAVVGYGCLRQRLDDGWLPEEAISTPASVGPREVTAWGETKSLTAWSQDPRCQVTVNAVAMRLDQGLSPEEAIGEPSKRLSPLATAWGETKTADEWADDSRCVVSKRTLLNRLRNEWRAERAMTEPVREHDGLTAWGETKSLRSWARDPRGAVHHGIISRRLEQGWSPEDAITTPAKELDRTPLTAFGETKSQTEWTRDPRCRVKLAGLRSRLEAGMSVEEAIMTPPKESNREGLFAFGEWRTFAGWARDSRCSVEPGAIQHRLEKGMPPEEAITRQGKTTPRSEEAAIRPPRMPNFTRCVTAWGETKSLSAWGRDSRAAVRGQLIGKRIDAGIQAELAITTPGNPSEVNIQAFGETKNSSAWEADPRCGVSSACIRGRLAKGWTAEAAIVTPDPRTGLTVPIEAFGEAKTLVEWARDARCAIAYPALAARVRKGMALEEALTTPGRALPESIEGITAFGETKRIHEWAADPRCAVAAPTLAVRLRSGWAAEDALTIPSVRRSLLRAKAA